MAASLIFCLLPMAACSIRKPPSGEDVYQQAQSQFAHKEFNAAIEGYQIVIDKYPFSPYAEDAEMKIGLAYYEMKDYAEAVGTLDDFQRMHPTSKNLELVSYYIAMSYYDQIGREDQDQTKSEQALKHFEIIEQRFPEGSFAELARQDADVCREMLARHEMVVGNYYFKRANFRAAESRLAELMQKYPETPIAPDALFELGQSLEKEGKKYSAAQAFTALVRHYPDTPYTKKAQAELKKLSQPVDTEEDPLPLVLAETGYGNDGDPADHVVVRQRDALNAYDPSLGPAPSAATAASSAAAGTDKLAAVAHQSATAYGPDGLPVLTQPDTKAAPTTVGPATLKMIRLSQADPPMSIILDLTGPVSFDKRVEKAPGSSTAILTLKDVTADKGVPAHIVFDRSIFRDCDVSTSSGVTTVTMNTVPLADVSVLSLDGPPRLLITFTPQTQTQASN
ncbi:MAG: outer membrane protein assembly factor BamD [Candidatus Binataceae bacterium]